MSRNQSIAQIVSSSFTNKYIVDVSLRNGCTTEQVTTTLMANNAYKNAAQYYNKTSIRNYNVQ